MPTNPYLNLSSSSYMAQVKKMREPLRSQLLAGRFPLPDCARCGGSGIVRRVVKRSSHLSFRECSCCYTELAPEANPRARERNRSVHDCPRCGNTHGDACTRAGGDDERRPRRRERNGSILAWWVRLEVARRNRDQAAEQCALAELAKRGVLVTFSEEKQWPGASSVN